MKVFVLLVCLALCLAAAGCSGQTEDSGTKADPEGSESEVTSGSAGDYTLNTKVTDVINDPVFGDYGRLIFSVDRTISEDLELQDVGDILVWYNNVNPDRTVEIANYLKDQAASGEQIFYDIYTDEEKAEDPEKEDTGLFFSAEIRGHRPHARIWREPSHFFMKMRRNCRSTSQTILSGAVPRGRAWLHGWAPMGHRLSGRMHIRLLGQ